MRSHDKKSMLRHVVGLLATLPLFGCATTYRFVTDPEGAAVYHQRDGGNALLGTSPLEFEKSGLPEDQPFVVVFEKQGYEPLRMVVTPTDNAHTDVNARLKPGQGAANDPQTKRVRSVLGRTFKVQELVAAKRYVEALTLLKELEAEEPEVAELQVLKGSIYYLLSDVAGARGAWTKALALDASLDAVRVRLDRLKAEAPAPGQGGASP